MVKDYIQAEEKNTIVEDGVSNQHDEDKIAKVKCLVNIFYYTTT